MQATTKPAQTLGHTLHRILLAAMLIAATLFSNQATAQIPASERQVLLDFYTSTNGAGWTTKTNWNGAVGTECTWYGVTCLGGVVTGLLLGGNQLTGSLPPNLNGLINLQIFYANSNQLTGSIPSLSGLSNLQRFEINSNQLTGSIPSLTGLSNLLTFFVNSNQLTGSIPPMSGLGNLQIFYVSYNQLTGSIPSLSGLSNFQYFAVNNNQLTGSIPTLPSPTALYNGSSDVCPNNLTASVDAAWDAKIRGSGPWYTGCSTSVTPSAGANGSISPAAPVSAVYGTQPAFIVTPDAGFAITAVGGSCGGSLVGNTFTTLAITAACSVDATFNLLQSQTITGFSPSASVIFGSGAITLSAVGGGSINPVIFSTASAPSICTVSGNQVTLIGVGTCVVHANQAGTAGLYLAAPQVSANIAIQAAAQTSAVIASATATSLSFGATTTLSASGGSSTGSYSFASSNGNCTIIGTTLTAAGVGSCDITATRAADANYLAATSASITIAITQAAQTITFVAQSPASQIFATSGTFALSPLASASSGLAVIYTTTTPAVCTISGTTVSIQAVGICTLSAAQSGNTNFTPAASVTQSISIIQAAQAITFSAQMPATQTFVTSGSFALSPTASASSGLVVSYTSTTPFVCGISGTMVSILDVGICTISAAQTGNANFTAAATVMQSITISQASQTITFAAQTPATQTFALAGTFALSPVGSASSGLAVSYASLTPSVCSVTGVTVLINAVGMCTISASQAGNTVYAAAGSVTQAIDITQIAQTITFAAQTPSSQIFVAANTFALNPVASASSGLAVSYTSTTPSVCSIAAAVVSILTPGTCTILAAQAGNSIFASATGIAQSITIAQTPQTITFSAQSPASQTFAPAGTFALNPLASASSGLAVTYTSSTPAVCSVTGAVVLMISGGTCTVMAAQAGNIIFSAATAVTQSIVLTQIAQSITFAAQAPATQSYVSGGTFALSPVASASSSLAISYVSTTPTVCGISGVTVSISSAGTCTISAAQAGNTNYAAAAAVAQSITITQASQTITFTTQAPASQTFATSGTFALSPAASASSGLAASYTSATPLVCGVTGTSVSMVSVGTCTILAAQTGNTNFTPAAAVTQSVTITQAAQTVTFAVQTPATQALVAAGTFALSPAASASSGLAVSYSSTTPLVCSVTGASVSMVNVGICTISAAQAGNANFTAATAVAQSITITQGTQAIVSFAPMSPALVSTSPVGLSATGGASNLPVSFSTTSASTICTVVGTQVTYTGIGVCNLVANQAGNTNYTAAPAVMVAVTVNPGTQAINLNGLGGGTRPFVLNGTFVVGAGVVPGNSGSAVVYSSLTPLVCTASGSNGTTITMLTVGVCTIAANQSGNVNYGAAPQVTQSITLSAVVVAPPVRGTVNVSIAGVSSLSNPANGTVSPLGLIDLIGGGTLDIAINANPRYLAVVTGTCGGSVITATALVPQNAGSNTYRTSAITGDCTVVVRFAAVVPVLTIASGATSGSPQIDTPPNTTPAPSTSQLTQATSFTAALIGAVGPISANGLAAIPANVPGSRLFIAFTANGLPIAGCEAVELISTFSAENTIRKASCSTNALPLGVHRIAASFGGNEYNFAAFVDDAVTPMQALAHTVTATPTATPVVVPPVIVVPNTTPNAFVFMPQNDVPLNVMRLSNSITVAGINAAVPISISAASGVNAGYSIGCTAAFTAAAATVSNGDRVCVRVTSASNNGETVVVTLNIGGVSGVFNVTTVDFVAQNRYRIYVPSTKGHLFTTDKNEYDVLRALGATYVDEGVDHKLFMQPVTKFGQTTVPYYRLYIKTVRQHFWTTDRNEYDVQRARKEQFSDENIDGYLFLTAGVLGTVPLYRLALVNTAVHHWTTDKNEFDVLVATGAWVAEGAPGNPSGVTGYVMPK